VILRAGVTMAVAEEASVRVEAAGLKRLAEDIARGLGPLALDEIADRHGYQPRMRAKTSGATMVASDSMMYFGV